MPNFDILDIFPKKESVGDRPWGTEELLALVSGSFSGVKNILKFHVKSY